MVIFSDVMKQTFVAPEKVKKWEDTVFLAGTIDMGESTDWQSDCATQLNYSGFNVLNPRRKQWDNTLEQSMDNPIFYDQVTWELDGLEKSTYRLFYFLPDSKSPITLMELGLVCNMSTVHKVNTFVVCPDEFYRNGNVKIMCARYGIGVFSTLSDALSALSMHRYSGIISKNKPLTIYDW